MAATPERSFCGPRDGRILTLIVLLACCISLTLGFEHQFNSAGAALPSIEERGPASPTYWLESMTRHGRPAFNSNSSYTVVRNVKDWGAKGDGVANDTAAINAALTDGKICNPDCSFSTTTPAIVYFPSGTYMVDSPLLLYSNTQMVGDALNPPILQAMKTFFGIGIIDADVDSQPGIRPLRNSNNIYRQVRNFVIDVTLMPPSRGIGIHWQAGQASSLQNIVFKMVEGGFYNRQWGIFVEGGSGGLMNDLVFNGGNVGAFLGSQQVLSRNLVFNNCQYGIVVNWDWVWTFKSCAFNNCKIGIDISESGNAQSVGSILVQDSTFIGTEQAIRTSFSQQSTPTAGGTMVIDNCDFTEAPVAVAFPNGTTILEGGTVVQSFIQGRAYTTYDGSYETGDLTCYQAHARSARIQQLVGPPPKPRQLLYSNGKFIERSRPQYANYPATAFVSVKAQGAKGDGLTDDTAAIQGALNRLGLDQILYFDHGTYIISDTIQVPMEAKITGEAWPRIMAKGSSFHDKEDPKVMWRVGNPGDVGMVEMSDLVFETKGAASGAILVEWNLAGFFPGAAGMWDVHFRVGGTAGSHLLSDTCAASPHVITSADPGCIGAYMLMHVTPSGSPYIENSWGWVADHELDRPAHRQINVYVKGGLLVESTDAIWLYGTAYEHAQMYNYQIVNAQNVYMAIAESQTAPMQGNPNALSAFTPSSKYFDPDFHECKAASCFKTLALRVVNSTNILNYGAGFYSFANNFDWACQHSENCQEEVVSIERSEAIYLYGLTTKAVENMVRVDGVRLVPQEENANTYGQTVAVFEYP